MEDLATIAAQFVTGSKVTGFTPLGIGHINETYIGRCGAGRYIFQRINREIFPDVAALMSNVARVTNHLRERGHTTLHLVPTIDGGNFFEGRRGDCWRAFPFIEGTRSVSVAESPAQAAQAASAFGGFIRELADLPAPRLHETIPDFHNTPKRFSAFLAAVEADPLNRAAAAKAEIDSALANGGLAGVVHAAQAAGTVPERIAHNDAKIENVLFDIAGERAICVVDLDTTMPGTLLHDFGDLVRSAAATAGEEELDPARIGLSTVTFTALARGFVASCSGVMTAAECELLPSAGRLIAYEQALRFLTDHLQGDPYYRIRRAGQNLDRARNQLGLVAVLQRCEAELARICDEAFAAPSSDR